MNVSVDPDRRREGIATALLTALFERIGDPTAQLTLEVRQSNAGAIALYERFGFRSAGVRRRYYQDNGEDALIMWRTPATLRGHARRRAGGSAAPARFDPRARDELRRHLRRGRHARRARSAPTSISSQGVHDRYGGVVPEIASRHHLELVNAVVDDALARAGATLDDVELVAVTQGPGLVGALLVGVATAKGLAAARRLPLAPVDHLQGHVAANFLAPEPIEPPFLCLIASGGHTLLARVDRPRRLRGAGPDARRRRRRGVRQGRAAARARLPGRAGAVEAGRGGRPGGVRVPDRRARRRASTSRSRA